jgi:hypothetical protein
MKMDKNEVRRDTERNNIELGGRLVRKDGKTSLSHYFDLRFFDSCSSGLVGALPRL